MLTNKQNAKSLIGEKSKRSRFRNFGPTRYIALPLAFCLAACDQSQPPVTASPVPVQSKKVDEHTAHTAVERPNANRITPNQLHGTWRCEGYSIRSYVVTYFPDSTFALRAVEQAQGIDVVIAGDYLLEGQTFVRVERADRMIKDGIGGSLPWANSVKGNTVAKSNYRYRAFNVVEMAPEKMLLQPTITANWDRTDQRNDSGRIPDTCIPAAPQDRTILQRFRVEANNFF